MADPFGIVVSVAGLVGLGVQVSNQVCTLVNSIKDAPESISGLKDELDSLHTILGQLQDTLKDKFKDSPPFSGPVAAGFRAVLDNCDKVLKRLERLMKKFNASAGSGRWEVLIQNIQFVFREQDILKIQRSLEAYKGTLSITLLLMLMQTAYRIDKKTSENRLVSLTLLRQQTKAQLESPLSLDSSSRSTLQNFLNIASNLSTDAGGSPAAYITNEISGDKPNEKLDNELDEGSDEKPDEEGGKKAQNRSAEEKSTKDEREALNNNRNSDREEALTDVNENPKQTMEEETSPEEIEEVGREVVASGQPNIKPERKTTISEAAKEFTAPLRIAAVNGDVQMVLLMLEFGADVNSICDGGTPLKCAAFHGREATVELLLARGADPNLQHPLNSTVSWSGTPGIALKLLNAGAIATPAAIHMAAEAGNTTAAQYLLDAGADADSIYDGSTPLKCAAFHGREATVELLLTRGADPNLQHPLNSTVSWSGTPEIALKLLNAGAIATPAALHMAAEAGNTAAAKHLLDAGVDANSIYDGSTPLRCAAFHGREATVELLLTRGANPNLQHPLNSTVSWSGTPEIALKLLNAGAIATPAALRIAAEAGNTAAAKHLLDAGANVNAVAEDSATALSCAVLHGREDTVKLLLERGADWKVGRNPLMIAVSHQKLSIARELASRGARPG